MLGLAGIVSIIAILLMVVSFASGIWLVVVAFKRSALWGILTLVVPFAAVAFAIKFWQDAKKPFLTSILSSVLSTVLLLVGAGFAAASAVSREAAGQIAAGQLAPDPTLQATAEQPVAPQRPRRDVSHAVGQPTEPMRTSTEPAPARFPAQPLSLSSNRQASAKQLYDSAAVSRDGFAAVALSDAAQLIGRRVRVITTGGQVHSGEMLRADAHGVQLERWLRGGSAILDFSKSEIESLQLDVN